MTRYVYIKKTPKKQKQKSFWASIFFLGSGFSLLSLVFWPILSFEFFFPNSSSEVVSPVSSNFVLGASADSLSASSWFPQASKKTFISKIDSYTLSVPKLGIKDATVVVGSDDLSKSLIQWGGTALPGEFGNTVIFGHSVLPAFYNPKNYMTIFSTLPTLKEDDEIFIYSDGITYRYQVFERKVVDPSELSVLEQRYDGSYLSLITCVPPGTVWKRLVIKARLIKI